MGKPQNIYWVTETEDNANYISMQAPNRCFSPKKKKHCFPKPGIGRSFIIDNSNNITVKQENKQIIKDNKIDGNNNTTGGEQSNASTVDAVQVSVFVVVPIIDSFDTDALPINGPAGQYRVAAGGQNLDIQVDGNGTYVNGERVEGSQLEDGTRIYVYRKDTVETESDKE